MNKYYYNGVLLPEIPSDVLAEYPYTFIIEQSLLEDGGSHTTQSALVCVNHPVYIEDDCILATEDSKCCTYQITNDEWEVVSTDLEVDASKLIAFLTTEVATFGVTISLIWTNTDIPNGSSDATDIYMYASEPLPYEEKMYITKESTFVNIANAIREKTGKSDSICPSDMATEIETIETSNGGGAELNIHYGDTAPEDTSKLWVKTSKPNNVIVSPEVSGNESLSVLGATLKQAMYRIGVGAVGTKIYLFGGAGGSISNEIQVFDTETETLTTLSATLNNNSCGIGVGVVGTKIYLFGGYDGANYADSIQVFDTETETIRSASAGLPNATYEIGVGVVGTKIYLFGGRNGSTSQYNTIYMFDTETETLVTLPVTLSSSSDGIGVGVVGTKIYLFGGQTGRTSRTNKIQVFDTQTRAITDLATTTQFEMGYASAGVVGTKIYIFGGYTSNSNDGAIIQVFDTRAETISTLDFMMRGDTYNMYSIGVGVVGTKMYLFGGFNVYNGAENTIRKFVVEMILESEKLQIQSSLSENLFNILNGDAVMEIGVSNVYLGNSEGVGELVETCLYKDGAWTQI